MLRRTGQETSAGEKSVVRKRTEGLVGWREREKGGGEVRVCEMLRHLICVAT